MRQLTLKPARLFGALLLGLSLVIGPSSLMAAGGQNNSQSSATAGGHAGAPSNRVMAHGIDASNMDKTCKPCEDFFHYADGGWLAKNPVPADHASWGTFNTLQDKNREVLHQILEGAAQNRN